MPIADWAPTTSDVGALLRARTKDRNGNELGDFTEDTRPTGAQVESLIEQAADDLSDSLGVLAITNAVYGSARRVAALGAALLVELGYFPEQVGTGRSPYTQLKDLYDERLKALRAAIEAGGGDVPGDAGSDPQGPVWSFPPAPTVATCDWGSVRLPGGHVIPVVEGGPVW